MTLNPATTFIDAKNVARIINRTVRYAYRLLNNIRKKLGKQSHQSITVKEFCSYTGLKLEDVLPQLS